MKLGINVVLGLSTLFSVSAFGSGCTVKSDSSDAFRDPIPQSSDVALAVPGSSAGASTTSSAAGLRLSGGGGSGDYASYYVFTRDISAGVDFGTGSILTSVWLIVNQPATTIAGNTATWGPGAGALDPTTWRFVVTEIGDAEYDYELDGRPKSSTSDSDFKAVLTGHGYGKSRAELRKFHDRQRRLQRARAVARARQRDDRSDLRFAAISRANQRAAESITDLARRKCDRRHAQSRRQR
jgi:hypothetical protein